MTDHLPTPTLDELQSLDGRRFAELTPDEITVLNFFCKYGRKYGVIVINKADPHSRVEVINGATAGLAGRLRGNCPDITRKVQIGGPAVEYTRINEDGSTHTHLIGKTAYGAGHVPIGGHKPMRVVEAAQPTSFCESGFDPHD